MRYTAITILAVFFAVALVMPSNAASRTPRGKFGKTPDDKSPKTEKIEKPKAEKVVEKDAKTVEGSAVTPQEILLRMLVYESSMGILDYMVDVVEVTVNTSTKQSKTERKEIFFLAPARSLTIKDGIPIYYVDENIFGTIVSQVDLAFLPDETLEGVECYVIKMTPKEDVFQKNVKHYYLAKDDLRKIRIEATRFNVEGKSVFNVTDFTYHNVEEDYYLPLKSESRMYDERDFLLQSTTSTFLHWKFNLGLKPEFFDKKLVGFKLYDVVK